jgi:uncharacterized protein YggE
MRRLPYLSLCASLLLVARVGSAQDQPVPFDPRPHVETVGTGERRIPPDRATVLLFVQSKALTAAEAAAENARAVTAVRDTLRQLGFNVTTASYNVSPDYEPPRPMPRDEGPRQVGYMANTTIRAQLSRVDQVGRAIDAGLARGATGVQGVFFESSQTEEARRAALADAAGAARRDAEALARALGGTLGPLISASTAGGNDPRRSNVMIRGSSPVGYQTEVTPTEILVSAGVITRWRFVPN